MTRTDCRRVLIANWFSRTLELEGAGSLLFGLSAAMKDRGWEVRMLLPEGNYPARSGVSIVTYRAGISGLLEYLKAVGDQSSETDAVLLFENNPNMAFVARYSRRPAQTFCYFFTPLQPLSTAWRSGLNRQAFTHTIAKHSLWSRLQSWSSLRCIVQTHFQAEQLRRLGAAEVHVIPGCGVSRARPILERSSARIVLGWNRSPVVGYLGHYSRAKGVDVLVQAMARTDQGVLALAHSGKGRLMPIVLPRLERLRESGRVREMGVTDVGTFLTACDVVALPYVTSSVHHLPQVLMEAHAAGTPVITTHIGGVSDGHRDGETGWLIPAQSVEMLAAALKGALADRAHCHALGRSARRIFESRWCVEEFADSVSGLLERSLSA